MQLRAFGIFALVVSTLAVLLVVYSSASEAQDAGVSEPTLADAQPVQAPVGVEPTRSRTVRLTAAGDHGGRNSRAGQTLDLVAELAPVAHLALGDLSYSERVPESAWCEWVIDGDKDVGVSGVGSIPVQVVAGNHEDDRRLDGFIRKFADCLPDRLDSEGDYGVEYYSDIGGLVRVIMIAADLTVDGEHYGYGGGSHRKWLQQAVLGARADGIPWVVVGMHKVCVTTSTKSCEVGESVMDWLLAPGRADLILQGHEHGVQRSHQLRCVNVDKSTPGCIVDTDGNHSQGRGGVILIGGSFGRDSYRQNPDDSEAGYFAAQMPGDESPDDEQQGVWQLDFSSSSLKAQWVGSTSAYKDAFVMAASSLGPASGECRALNGRPGRRRQRPCARIGRGSQGRGHPRVTTGHTLGQSAVSRQVPGQRARLAVQRHDPTKDQRAVRQQAAAGRLAHEAAFDARRSALHDPGRSNSQPRSEGAASPSAAARDRLSSRPRHRNHARRSRQRAPRSSRDQPVAAVKIRLAAALRAHARVKDLVATCLRTLGLSHGKLSVGDKILGACRLLRERDTCAGANAELELARLER